MRTPSLLLASISFALASTVSANENTGFKPLEVSQETPVAIESPKLTSTDYLFKKKIEQLNVNANASQPDDVKDPFEGVNRKIFAFNDAIDRNFLRPIAVQYATKVPEQVRTPYGQFRRNLAEPWNAVNQVMQLKPKRAVKTLGRFSVNTLTSLGFADPARRLGLDSETENLGITFGYYGVPSGPFVMLPIFGPSTLRDTVGFAGDAVAQPERFILQGQNAAFAAESVLGVVDMRAQVLDLDSLLQDDPYATLRDLYLQRQSYRIASKKGVAQNDASFVTDEADDNGNAIEPVANPDESSTTP